MLVYGRVLLQKSVLLWISIWLCFNVREMHLIGKFHVISKYCSAFSTLKGNVALQILLQVEWYIVNAIIASKTRLILSYYERQNPNQKANVHVGLYVV